MRHRYTVRNPAGEILSGHRTVLGALDGKARSKAADSYLYDEREQSRVEQPATPEEAADLLVRLTPGEKASLREVAREVGAVAPSGQIAGQPSLARLVKGIASGELVVSRKGRSG